MWLGSRSEKQLQIAKLTADLSEQIAEQMTRRDTGDLLARLNRLAAVAADLSGISGAILLAVDEQGYPAGFGSRGLSFSDEVRAPEELLKGLGAVQSDDATWSPIGSAIIKANGTPSTRLAHLIRADGRFHGVLLVGGPEDQSVMHLSLDALAGSVPHFACAIHEGLQARQLARMEMLQKLTNAELDRGRPNLQNIVDQLANIFETDAVTILLEDKGELRLSASNDRRLGKQKKVTYGPGAGLTGWIFENGTALCLKNGYDAVEIRAAAGIERAPPIHPETTLKGHKIVHFLGLPMRFGDRVEGVLRLWRAEAKPHFSSQEVSSLQSFADLLGVFLNHSWELGLHKCIMQARAEAIGIARRDRTGKRGSSPKFVFANQGAEVLFARQQDDIIGHDVTELYAPGAYAYVQKELQKAINEGQTECGPIPSRIIRPSGEVRLVDISFRFLQNPLVQPPAYHTIGLMRDTTESQIQAEQHRRLLEMLSEKGIAYFRADVDGKTIETTPAESEITGYSQREIRSISRKKLYPPGQKRAEILKRVRERDGNLVRLLQRFMRKDGTIFWAEGALRLLKNSAGQEIGIEGLYREVTDRILLQGFLDTDTNNILKESELFEELKRNAEFPLDYMSCISHQLKTPLGSLAENLRNIQLGITKKAELNDRIKYIIGQTLICGHLLRNLSYMDKFLRGEEFQRERVSIAKLVRETKRDFMHLLREKHIRLNIDNKNLERCLIVRGHPELLRQVIVNLLDNAIKYSAERSKIDINGYHWPEGRIFEITNKGLPIPEDAREKVFTRGFRTNAAKMSVPHGTGLGLWLVKKIVDTHRANIRCQEITKGDERRTAFLIVFPEGSSSVRRRK
ncbi:MAG: PAS domain S-box protein [bacterium]|nr:PAS domain S-box protein [bacterium]